MLTNNTALLITNLIDGERIPTHTNAESWLAVNYLLVFGSLIGFTAYN